MKKILILLALMLTISACSKGEDNISKHLEYVNATATISDIDNVISISGNVNAGTKKDVESPYAISRSSMTIKEGDVIEVGQEVAFLSSDDITKMMSNMYESYDKAIKELNDLTVETTAYTFKAPVEGYVKNIRAKEGQSIESIMDEYGYLAQIVDSRGNVLYNLVGVSGTVTSVANVEGSRVKVGTAIVFASKTNDDFSTKIDKVNQLTENINNLKKYKNVGLSVTATEGGVVSKLGFANDGTGEEPIVEAGETLYTVVDPTTYYISGKLGEANYSLVSIGSKVIVEVPALSRNFEGEVRYVSASGSENTFPIEVAITDGGAIQLGMSANLKVIASSYSDRLTVPIDSVFTNVDGRKYVLLASDTPTDTLAVDERAQVVTTGKTDGHYIEIVTGLNVDQVVLQPTMAQYIPDSSIKPVSPGGNELIGGNGNIIN